jgi:hypothetical protein
VDGVLGDAASGSAGSGTGTFAVTLTHYRTTIFGHCVTAPTGWGSTVSIAGGFRVTHGSR